MVRSIREFAAELAAQPKQDTPIITSAIENLENKVRLAARVEAVSNAPGPESVNPTQQKANVQERAKTEAPVAALESKPSERRPTHGNNQLGQPAVIQRSVADTLMDAIRSAVRGVSQPTPGFEPPHTPMKERIAAFEARIQTEKEDKLLARAETSGRAALESLQGLQNTAAASVLSRIDDAARNNPGGLEAVLSEMRPGGRFADLRTQFNAALNTEHAASAAYDKAAASLARYGEQRPALDAILAKRADAANLSAKFEQLDAEIGEAAGRVPSRRDGKTMIDDLAKQIVEILFKAVDSVRAVFSRNAGPSASAGPSPSPGMSP